MKQITLTGAVALFGLGAFSVASHADTKVTVQSGDTLNKIAVANNTTVDNLQQLNNIKNINLIYVGDEIVITKDNTQVKESTYVPAQDESQQVQAPVQTNSQPAQSSQTDTTDYGVYTNPEIYANRWNNTDNTAQVTPAASQPATTSSSAEQTIINMESSGNATASNGRYVGLYGMDSSRLGGDMSVANQQAVAQQYLNERYNGSWDTALAFHDANGWW